MSIEIPAPAIEIPSWLSTYVATVVARLGLQQWEIDIKLAYCLYGGPDTLASCSQIPNLNSAILTFRADVEDTPRWHRIVIHELLHVAHARVDDTVETVIIPSVPYEEQQMGRRSYNAAMEAYTDQLSRVLAEALSEALAQITEQDDHGDGKAASGGARAHHRAPKRSAQAAN